MYLYIFVCLLFVKCFFVKIQDKGKSSECHTNLLLLCLSFEVWETGVIYLNLSKINYRNYLNESFGYPIPLSSDFLDSFYFFLC